MTEDCGRPDCRACHPTFIQRHILPRLWLAPIATMIGVAYAIR